MLFIIRKKALALVLKKYHNTQKVISRKKFQLFVIEVNCKVASTQTFSNTKTSQLKINYYIFNPLINLKHPHLAASRPHFRRRNARACAPQMMSTRWNNSFAGLPKCNLLKTKQQQNWYTWVQKWLKPPY